MNVNENITALVQYGLDKKLIEPCDKTFIINQLLYTSRVPGHSRPRP